MKKIKIISLISLAIIALNACTPDNNFTIGAPQNRLQQLSGTWKLQTVTQIDLDAKSKGFVDPSRPDIDLIQQDITQGASYSDLSLTFNVDGSTIPSTFSINYGNAPKIFKISSGSWKVDNLQSPGTVKLINSTDTITTLLSNVNNLPQNLLTLQFIKYSGKKAVIQYNYNFKKN